MTIEPFVAKRGGILTTGATVRQDLPIGSRREQQHLPSGG